MALLTCSSCARALASLSLSTIGNCAHSCSCSGKIVINSNPDCSCLSKFLILLNARQPVAYWGLQWNYSLIWRTPLLFAFENRLWQFPLIDPQYRTHYLFRTTNINPQACLLFGGKVLKFVFNDPCRLGDIKRWISDIQPRSARDIFIGHIIRWELAVMDIKIDLEMEIFQRHLKIDNLLFLSRIFCVSN